MSRIAQLRSLRLVTRGAARVAWTPLQRRDVRPPKELAFSAPIHEYEFMFINRRLLRYGILLWVVGTIVLRVAGQRLLPPSNSAGTVLLIVATFPAAAWVVRRICRRAHLRREDWLAGAIAIVLPTLSLDAFSAALFPVIFPNIAPGAAGVFGGWMLACCAGGLLGVTIGHRSPL